MFRSITLATFRSKRRPAVAWGAALAAFTLLTMWSNWRSEYPTEEARQRLAEQVEGGLAFVQVLFGEPERVDEFRGHLEWRGLGLHPLLLGLFMVMSATAVSRGAEERGELDLILTTPRSRSRIFIEQASGVALALLTACAFIWFAALVSGLVAGEPVPPPGLALLSIVNLGLVAALFGAIALLVAQLVRSRRAAATTVGAILVGSYLWSNLGLVAGSLEGWRWLSPFYLYSRSTPLADGQVSAWALGLLTALTLSCLAGAGLLFTRRDADAPASVPWPAFMKRASRGPGHGAGGTRLFGDSFQWGLRAALGQTLIWGLGAASFAALFAAVTPAIRRGFEDLSEAREAVAQFEFDLTSDAGIISALLFLVLPLLLCLFAATVTTAMASEEQSGRLELDLVYPVRRISYFLQRATAALLAVAVATALAASAFLVSAFLMDFDLDWARAILASVLLVLPPSIVVAFGYALAGWRPRLVTGGVATALAASFFYDLLAPALDLPGPLRKLSIFQLYGQPLLDGVRWVDMAVMLALVVAFLAVGAFKFERRDILK
ncbi:ABC transporter permease subunit [bacterium]|nr:ABC transporter permease subunit [bacterium]